MLQQPYSIKLKPDDPFSLAPPRRVAIPLLRNMKAELERTEGLGVISRIEEPTEWCSGMVPVPAENGAVQLCVNLTHLNETVCREKYILPSVEETLGSLTGAQVFRNLFPQTVLQHSVAPGVLSTEDILDTGRTTGSCMSYG